jgi:transcriptional regulator with XRE-family HTH domain
VREVHVEWGDRLRRARVERGLTRAAVARACGVATSTISRAEMAVSAPSDELKWKIAGALRLPMNELWPWPDGIPPIPEVAPRADRAGRRLAYGEGPGGTAVREAGESEDGAAVLSVAQVARLLGMKPASVYAHIEAGDLPFKPLDLPGRKRFSRTQVERFLAGE